MPINDEKLKHGFVISQVVFEISENSENTVNVSEDLTRSGYQVLVENKGDRVCEFGLFIKYSKKRNSPWRYSFMEDHQVAIDLMKEAYGEVFIAFINKDDGVACVNYELLKQLLDDNHEAIEWVAVRSGLNKQYSLSGKDGKLDKKISRSDFPRIINSYIQSLPNITQINGLGEKKIGIWKKIFKWY